MDFGGAVVNIVHCRKLTVLSIEASHWPSHGSLPLTELLLGMEESFLLPIEVIK